MLLITISTCDAFVNGWQWTNHLPGYHCMGIPVPRDTFYHLGLTWEQYVVKKSDWKVGDLLGFEISLPQEGMRIFRCFTFKGHQPAPYYSNTENDNKISFFVMGLYDSCTFEELYSSGTLCIWSSRQFKYDHGSITNKEYFEKVASEFNTPQDDVCLEYWPQPNIEISLFVNTEKMAFKLLVHENGTIYQVSTFMPNPEHRKFFLESFRIE